MKKLLFAVVAFSLLATSSSIAEPTHPNELGLYTTPDGYGATGTDIIGAPVYVYLVLTKPTDVQNGGTPVSGIYGFECTLTFDPIPNNNLFALSMSGPPDSIDIGQSKQINNGYLDFIVGISPSSPVPVVNDSALLVSFSFLNVRLDGFDVTLGPVDQGTIPGQMIFWKNSNYPESAEVMYSVGGSPESPVFIFGGEAVAVENESFGSVKALYR